MSNKIKKTPTAAPVPCPGTMPTPVKLDKKVKTPPTSVDKSTDYAAPVEDPDASALTPAALFDCKGDDFSAFLRKIATDAANATPEDDEETKTKARTNKDKDAIDLDQPRPLSKADIRTLAFAGFFATTFYGALQDDVAMKLGLNNTAELQGACIRDFETSFNGKLWVNTVTQHSKAHKKKRILRIQPLDDNNDDETPANKKRNTHTNAKAHISDQQAVAAVGGRTLYRNDGFFKTTPCFADPIAHHHEPGKRLFLLGHDDHIFGFALPPLTKADPPGIALHSAWKETLDMHPTIPSNIARHATNDELQQALVFFTAQD
jgi:hypothetical protein